MSLLRPITPQDHPAVLALNQEHVDLLAPLDQHGLESLVSKADLAHVIDFDGQRAGFVVTFTPGASYDSVNYHWFAEEYDDFYYLDRVVIAPAYRRRGLATRVYDEVEQRARAHGRMALEINIDPPNHASLAFHAARGYTEIAQQRANGHVVSLQSLELPR